MGCAVSFCYYNVVCRALLCFVVVWCALLWYGVLCCVVLWCGMVWCGVVWHVWCGVVWCGVVRLIFLSRSSQTKRRDYSRKRRNMAVEKKEDVSAVLVGLFEIYLFIYLFNVCHCAIFSSPLTKLAEAVISESHFFLLFVFLSNPRMDSLGKKLRKKGEDKKVGVS